MVQSQFAVAWGSYKSNICGGFSALQQNAEFVDMTIAADGHYVKVHQVLIALASPYLKDLINSAPCQHPIIFLNNVSHRVLRLLLEYIYTGEVLVPADCLALFGATASSLHIKGLENITHTSPAHMEQPKAQSQVDDTELQHVKAIKRVKLVPSQEIIQIRTEDVANTDPGIDQHDDDYNRVKSMLAGESTDHIHSQTPRKRSKHSTRSDNVIILSARSLKDATSNDCSEIIQDTSARDDDDDWNIKDDNMKSESDTEAPTSNLQFTVSIRGSLQVILNRYIYNLYSARTTGVRRWRCVDYRNSRCPAFVITKGNTVLNRGNLHNHAFHDKKILVKIEKNAVFAALDLVESYKEKMDNTPIDDNEQSQDILEGFSVESKAD